MLELAPVDGAHHVALERAREDLHLARGAREPAARERRDGLRARQVEALEEIDAELERGDGLALGLDALGDDERADAPREPDQALERLLLVVVGVDARDQASIDLDDVGPEQRDAIEVRVTRAHVVEHDEEATGAERRGEGREARHVVEARLEELDGDARG